MGDYSKYLDGDVGLNRDLTHLEIRKIRWLSNYEPETVGVFIDLFKEFSRKSKSEGH